MAYPNYMRWPDSRQTAASRAMVKPTRRDDLVGVVNSQNGPLTVHQTPRRAKLYAAAQGESQPPPTR